MTIRYRKDIYKSDLIKSFLLRQERMEEESAQNEKTVTGNVDGRRNGAERDGMRRKHKW